MSTNNVKIAEMSPLGVVLREAEALQLRWKPFPKSRESESAHLIISAIKAEMARQVEAQKLLVNKEGQAVLESIKQTDWNMDKGYWEGKRAGLVEAIRTLFPELRSEVSPDDQFGVWL